MSAATTSAAALMLRAVSNELKERIIPHLTFADSIERSTLATQVLEHLATDIDTLAQIAPTQVPELRSSLTDALASLEQVGYTEHLSDWLNRLREIPPETDLACQREIKALRDLSAQVVRACADRCAGLREGDERKALEAVAAMLGRQDSCLLDAISGSTSLQQGSPKKDESPEEGSPSAPPQQNLTPEAVTSYLRGRYQDAVDIRATEVVAVPGGRSKKTWLISLENSGTLPQEVVIRQDYQLHYQGTKVRDEYEPLAKFSGLGLPVPKPLLLEANESSLGQPFILMEKREGSPPGTYFGLRENCPGAFEDLAMVLAHIHRADPNNLGFTVDSESDQNLLRLIDNFQERWRKNSNKPSPVIDYAFAWARRVCLENEGMVALVHGDVGPHNMLVANHRLTALLDWEFSHVGDPAEDLGIARVYAEDVMQWDEFMRLYLKAGGRDVPERRIELAMVLHFLKGACLVAVSGRNFEEGWTKEFIKGGTAFVAIRQIEGTLTSLLRRFGALG